VSTAMHFRDVFHIIMPNFVDIDHTVVKICQNSQERVFFLVEFINSLDDSLFLFLLYVLYRVILILYCVLEVTFG